MAKLKYGTKPNVQLERLGDGVGHKLASVYSAKSGRFVVYDISDQEFLPLANNGVAIVGYTPWVGTIATDLDVIPVFDVRGVTFELPYAASGAAATLTDAVGRRLVGNQISCYVDSNIQYADNETSNKVFEVVDYDVAENTLWVKVIEANIVAIA